MAPGYVFSFASVSSVLFQSWQNPSKFSSFLFSSFPESDREVDVSYFGRCSRVCEGMKGRREENKENGCERTKKEDEKMFLHIPSSHFTDYFRIRSLSSLFYFYFWESNPKPHFPFPFLSALQLIKTRK